VNVIGREKAPVYRQVSERDVRERERKWLVNVLSWMLANGLGPRGNKERRTE